MESDHEVQLVKYRSQSVMSPDWYAPLTDMHHYKWLSTNARPATIAA
jgi:hypothetical protein